MSFQLIRESTKVYRPLQESGPTRIQSNHYENRPKWTNPFGDKPLEESIRVYQSLRNQPGYGPITLRIDQIEQTSSGTNHLENRPECITNPFGTNRDMVQSLVDQPLRDKPRYGSITLKIDQSRPTPSGPTRIRSNHSKNQLECTNPFGTNQNTVQPLGESTRVDQPLRKRTNQNAVQSKWTNHYEDQP